MQKIKVQISLPRLKWQRRRFFKKDLTRRRRSATKLQSSIVTHQHCHPQVKLVEELRDEDVDFQDVRLGVFLLHISKDVYEPLKVSMRRTDPQEVNLNKTTNQNWIRF